MTSNNIFIFDTETTSVIDPKIVEISILTRDTSKKNNLGVSTGSFINPERPISLEAMAVHDITDEMVKNSPTIKESTPFMFMEEYNDESCYLVGHNIGFDVIAFENSTGVKLKYQLIDTYKVAYHHFEDNFPENPASNYKLNYLRYYMGLNDKILESNLMINKSLRTTHSALFDVIMTKEVFEVFLENHSLEEMVAISSRPLIFKKLVFGKYKGITFEEVAITDYGYLQWLFKTELDKCKQKGMSDDELKNNQFLATIIYYLDKYKVKTDD